MPRDDCAQPEVARKDLETEIDILQRLQHPNIVEMLGAGFVNPLDVDAADGEDRGEFRDVDQASLAGVGVFWRWVLTVLLLVLVLVVVGCWSFRFWWGCWWWFVLLRLAHSHAGIALASAGEIGHRGF